MQARHGGGRRLPPHHEKAPARRYGQEQAGGTDAFPRFQGPAWQRTVCEARPRFLWCRPWERGPAARTPARRWATFPPPLLSFPRSCPIYYQHLG